MCTPLNRVSHKTTTAGNPVADRHEFELETEKEPSTEPHEIDANAQGAERSRYTDTLVPSS
jgi:hypothetical protein